METQVQEFIDKIKKEGIATAEEHAARLKTEAAAQAKSIVEQAEKDAAGIRTKAQAEADQLKISAQAALKQASRDITITVRKELEAVIQRLFKEIVATSFKPKIVEEAILILIKSWAEMPASAEVLVPPATLKALEDLAKGTLSDLAKKGITIKASPNVTVGFRIQEADGSAHYDFGDKDIAEALAAYVNPYLAGILTAKE